MLMTNEIMVIIAHGDVALSNRFGRENPCRFRRTLNYRAFYKFLRPACMPIEPVPLIVCIFSAVNIYTWFTANLMKRTWSCAVTPRLLSAMGLLCGLLFNASLWYDRLNIEFYSTHAKRARNRRSCFTTYYRKRTINQQRWKARVLQEFVIRI